MSEKKNNKTNNASLIATIVVAALALAAVIVMIVIVSGGGRENPSSQSTAESAAFRPTAELERECEYAAHDLISGNYEIVRLFVTQGLPHLDEPYGNLPEDGIYTVDTEKSRGYNSYEDIENKVKSIYTEEAAEKVLKSCGENGIEVYKNRTIQVDNPDAGESAPRYKEETVLGINADFKADSSRDELWESCSLTVLPTSETECEITVYLAEITESTDLSSIESDKILKTKMVKNGSDWRLTKFVY